MNYKYKLVIKCSDLTEARGIADQFMIRSYPIKIEPVFLDFPNENEVDFYRVFIYFNNKENFYIEKERLTTDETSSDSEKKYTTDIQRIWKYNIIKAAVDKGSDLISIKFDIQKEYQLTPPVPIRDMLFNSDYKIDHKTMKEFAEMLDTPIKTLLDSTTELPEDRVIRLEDL
jgi:hypothetical protein